MLTPVQQKWINHLSDSDLVKIIPYDPSCSEKFERLKQRVKNVLGRELPLEHHGASSLGISGQDEIDIYLPVAPENFAENINLLKKVFGEPGSLYPLERARFRTDQDGKRIDVFVINKEHSGWIKCKIFEKYLKTHPETLEKYRKIKEEAAYLSTREYYRRKIEFINGILAKAGN